MKTTWIAALVWGVGASGAPAQPIDFARAYGAELRADAAERLSAQAAGPSGPKVGGYLQFRYVINGRDNVPPTVPPAPVGEDLTVGFQDAKIKLTVAGTITDEISYSLLTSARLADGTIELQEAIGNWKANENWTIRWGQFKLPLLREELVGDVFQLAADRSATNSEFTQSRSQLVQAGYQADALRFFLAFSDGLGTLNTDFNSTVESDYAFTGRLEWKYSGDDWARFNDFTSWRGSGYAGMLGAAAHWQSGGDTDNTFDAERFEGTVDASVEGSGWNAFAAFVIRTRTEGATGLVAQGGAFVTDALEIFARYDAVFPRLGDDFNTITAGVNYYVIPESHAIKFTLDAQYFIDEQSTSIVAPSTLVGLQPSAEEGQWVIRLQAQLRF